MNASVIDGGVMLIGDADSSWVETADVRCGLGSQGWDAGRGNVMFTEYGGSAIVGMSFLSNQTVGFGGGSVQQTVNFTLEMEFWNVGMWLRCLGAARGRWFS